MPKKKAPKKGGRLYLLVSGDHLHRTHPDYPEELTPTECDAAKADLLEKTGRHYIMKLSSK